MEELEDNLIDAEELNNYRKLQEMTTTKNQDRVKRNKSESAQLSDSSSQDSLEDNENVSGRTQSGKLDLPLDQDAKDKNRSSPK